MPKHVPENLVRKHHDYHNPRALVTLKKTIRALPGRGKLDICELRREEKLMSLLTILTAYLSLECICLWQERYVSITGQMRSGAYPYAPMLFSCWRHLFTSNWCVVLYQSSKLNVMQFNILHISFHLAPLYPVSQNQAKIISVRSVRNSRRQS